MMEASTGRRGQCTKKRCKDCCKSFTAFLFSTLGLVIMVAAYATAGGFLFQKLEEPKKQEAIKSARARAASDRRIQIEKMWDITKRLNILYYENWTAEVEPVMTQFQTQVYDHVIKHQWDGLLENDEVHSKWNFPGALLYAVTAITTIGYGHVTPATIEGKLGTIFYCVVGIPLTVMCIANVGKFFAQVLRILYHACCCGICCVCCLAYRKKKAALKAAKNLNNNGSDPNLEVVGNGGILTITNDPEKNPRVTEHYMNLSNAQVWLRNVKSKFSHSLRDDTTVPAYLCLIIMGGYIFGGALLFSLWEDWDYITGSYFCFVTLTTIGFGDFVPGVADKDNDPRKLILCSVYVLCGLALIGMCINLMQEDVLQKIKWIAQKIGIIENDKKTKKKRKSLRKESSTAKFTDEAAGYLMTKEPGNKPVISEDKQVMTDNHKPIMTPVNNSSWSSQKRSADPLPHEYGNRVGRFCPSYYDEFPISDSEPTGKPVLTHSEEDEVRVPLSQPIKIALNGRSYNGVNTYFQLTPDTLLRKEPSNKSIAALDEDLQALDKILEDPIFCKSFNVDANLGVSDSEDDDGIVLPVPVYHSFQRMSNV